MKTTKFLFNVVLVLLALTFTMCTSDKSKKKAKKPVLDKLTEESYEELNYFRFPSPEEIFSFVQEKDFEYIPDIVNDFNNHNQYTGSKKQTVNLGVYISDLAYFTMFKQQDETFDYLNTVHKLCNKIKIESAFSSEFLNRVHNNLYEVDSLINLSSEAYLSIVRYLEANKKESTLAVLSIGTYVESLYLTMQFVDDYQKDKIIVQKIADQKYAFENLYMYIEQNLDKTEYADYYLFINDIKHAFDKIETVKVNETTNTETEDGKLVFGGGSRLQMSEEAYNHMKETITQARNKIIS